MKFISIDTETTGLDHNKCQVLEFGAVLVDTARKEPIRATFRALFLHDTITGEPYALNMNSSLIEEIVNALSARRYEDTGFVTAQYKCCILPDIKLGLKTPVEQNPNNFNISFNRNFQNWLRLNNEDNTIRRNLAGKNLAMFDLPFLRKHNIDMNGRHRLIDPSILYADWDKDEALPDLKTCLERAGLNPVVSHTAVDDALQVANLILAKINQK